MIASAMFHLTLYSGALLRQTSHTCVRCTVTLLAHFTHTTDGFGILFYCVLFALFGAAPQTRPPIFPQAADSSVSPTSKSNQLSQPRGIAFKRVEVIRFLKGRYHRTGHRASETSRSHVYCSAYIVKILHLPCVRRVSITPPRLVLFLGDSPDYPARKICFDVISTRDKYCTRAPYLEEGTVTFGNDDFGLSKEHSLTC
ncbi:hypothetical protein PROFUN_01521 [Planoprotostelium fungivorum]|uniref:Uncharacterized protein n=1 Tax=Planoprotostelium fungivorum TaxID=1890364 RepID=A0A2P6NTF7_9EUKA|nr:hypothetical protein PROFUN_01521 [Planoprotostelium fungivorum]